MLTVDYDRLRLGRGERMLDLGSGNGRHAFEALRRGADIVCVDLDPAGLFALEEMAEAMVLEGQVERGSLRSVTLADANQLPFADASFDRVIAAEVLEHIPTDSTAMSEIARVLRPGGIAAVTVPRYWPERICWVLSDEYHSNEGGHVRIYKRSELVAKLTDNGLRPLSAHHAHALHSPYWWIKCAVGVRRDDALPAKLYRRFLEWQIVNGSTAINLVERTLDPLFGKSLAVYVEKPA